MAFAQVEMRYSQDDLHHKHHRSKLSNRRRSTPNLWPVSQRNLIEEKEAGLLSPGGTLPADTFSIYAGILRYDKDGKSDSPDSLSRKSKKSRRKIIDFFKKQKDQKSFDNSSSTPGALFGQQLKDVCSPDGDPPLSILLLLHQLVSHGPSLKGIFRVSANYKECQALKDQLDSEATVDFASQNVKVLASTLKEYLRSLPDCLLTNGLYNDWVQTLDLDDVLERINLTKKILGRLPKCNFVLLQMIMCVLYQIQMNSEYNKMTSYNLAICIGQSMLWPPASPKAQTQVEAQATMKVARLLQFFLDNSLDIFGNNLPHILGEAQSPKNIADSGTDSDSFGVSAEDSHNFPMCGNDEIQLNVTAAPEVRSIGSSLESPTPSPRTPRHIRALPSHASSSLDSLELDSPETPDSCEPWHLSSDSGLFQSDLEQDHPPIPPPRRSKSKLRRQPLVGSPQMHRKYVSTPSLASISPLPSPTQPTSNVQLPNPPQVVSKPPSPALPKNPAQVRKYMTKKGADVYPKHLLRKSLLSEEEFLGDTPPASPSPIKPAQPPSYDETMQRKVKLQSGLNVSNDEILQQKMNSLRAQELYMRSMEEYQAKAEKPLDTNESDPVQSEMEVHAAPEPQIVAHKQQIVSHKTQIVSQKTEIVSHKQTEPKTDSRKPSEPQMGSGKLTDYFNYVDAGRMPRRSHSVHGVPRRSYSHQAMDTSRDNEAVVSSQRRDSVPAHVVKHTSPQIEKKVQHQNENSENVNILQSSPQTQNVSNQNVRSTARDTTRSYNKTKQSVAKEKNNDSQERSESRLRKRAQAEKDRSSQKNNNSDNEERVKTRRKSYRKERLSDTRLETERRNKVNLQRSKSDSCEHLGSLRLLSNDNNENIQKASFNKPRRASVTVKDRAWHKEMAQQYSKPLVVDVVPVPKYAYMNPEKITTSTPDPKMNTGRRWSRPVHPTRDLVIIDDKKKGGQAQLQKQWSIQNQEEEKENHHIPPPPSPPSPVTPIPQPEVYSPQNSPHDQDQMSEEELTISWSVAKLKNLFDQSQ